MSTAPGDGPEDALYRWMFLAFRCLQCGQVWTVHSLQGFIFELQILNLKIFR